MRRKHKDFGHSIKIARAKMKWTQAQLADALGVSGPLVSNWESGKVSPSTVQKALITRVLNTNTTEHKPEVESYGDKLRVARIENAWTQTELGQRVNVSVTLVSNWESGKVEPTREQKKKLQQLLGIDENSSAEQTSPQKGPSPFGVWLNRNRLQNGLSPYELASKAGVSAQAIYNIESGGIQNPRPETVNRLETALGKRLPAESKQEIREEATIGGLGELYDFQPYDPNDLPEVSGVYVFYDISKRPVYVGQSANIAKRIRSHSDKFWFKSPIVETGAYVEISDDALRNQVETLLIRFLKSNAVLNKQGVER